MSCLSRTRTSLKERDFTILLQWHFSMYILRDLCNFWRMTRQKDRWILPTQSTLSAIFMGDYNYLLYQKIR